MHPARRCLFQFRTDVAIIYYSLRYRSLRFIFGTKLEHLGLVLQAFTWKLLFPRFRIAECVKLNKIVW